jgi:hypothetical protein
MALAGALLRSGLATNTVESYVRSVARLGGDPKWNEDFVEHTERRLEGDKPTTGLPKLVQVLQLPKACEAVFREWLQVVGGDEPAAAKKTYELVCAKDVVMRPVDWLWKGHLQRGALELLTGIPGVGKSQVQCSYVGCMTKGRGWPDGSTGAAPANVIMVTAEDALDQTVVPRLVAAGTDLARVFFLRKIRRDDKKRTFLLGEDIELLEQLIGDVGNVGLVTLDPITAFMGKVDSHRATDVRGQLGPLADLAETTNTAFSCVTHPAKNASQKAIDHFIGSQAFIAAGRVGHLCVLEMEKDEDGEMVETGRRLFAHAKHSNSVRMATLAYTISEIAVGKDETGTVICSTHVVWGEAQENLSADQAIAAMSGGGKSKERGPNARVFLETILANGQMPVKKVEEHAATRGISERQLRRAREALGVWTKRDRFGPGGQQFWGLPGQSMPGQEEMQL